jgi:hypothetical protein
MPGRYRRRLGLGNLTDAQALQILAEIDVANLERTSVSFNDEPPLLPTFGVLPEEACGRCSTALPHISC